MRGNGILTYKVNNIIVNMEEISSIESFMEYCHFW